MTIKEGIYLIDKEASWTSFDVVAKMRGITGVKSIGHAGTLDPFATGLLIVLVGKEFTKRQDEFMKQDKVYEATLMIGFSSSTGDPEGIISEVTSYKEQGTGKLQIPSFKEVQNVLQNFVGEIEQIPPVHSAIKINGERAYKKARRGEDVQIPKRKVTIHNLELISYEYPLVKFKVKCSSGTYIRTLGMDIAEELGTKGYLTGLRRTKIGEYDIKDAERIQDTR